MRRRFGLTAALAATAVLCVAPAAAQLPALRHRPLSAAERTRLTSLESQLARVSRQRNVSASAVRAIAEALGARLTTTDPDALVRVIDRRAEELGAARVRIASLERDLEAADSLRLARAVAPLLQAADAAIESGDLAAAEARLADAASRFGDARTSLQGRVDQLAVQEADVLAQQAALRLTLSDWTGAAALYDRAAETAPASDPAARWRHRLAQARALADAGEEGGAAEGLTQALALLREQTLPLAPRADRPSDWAATQAELAAVLLALGSRRADPDLQAQAVAAGRLALEIRPPQADEADYAERRRQLAEALSARAILQGDRAQLQEAVALLRDAIPHVRDRAEAQTALGAALGRLGALEAGANASLTGSADAYRAAVASLDAEREPRRWAEAKLNLAVTLSILAQRGEGERPWRAALAETDAALSATRQEQFPEFWRRAQMIRAMQLDALSAVVEGPAAEAAFAESQAVYDALLPEVDRASAPRLWAQLQDSRANGLGRRGSQTGDVALLERALEAYTAASSVIGREQSAQLWGRYRLGAGDVLMELARRASGEARRARAEQAAVAYRDGLSAAEAGADAPMQARARNAVQLAERLLAEG